MEQRPPGGPVPTSRVIGLGTGSSAVTGATSTTTRRPTCSTPRSTPGSPCSTPRTCTATAGRRSASAGAGPAVGPAVRRDQGRPPRRPVHRRAVHAGEPAGLDRPVPPQPRRRHPRPRAAALPAAGHLRGRPGLRHPGRARRRGGDRRYGVSVETVAEGLRALQRPGVQSLQVILNIFRRKPLEELLPAAQRPASASSPGAAGQRPAHRQVRRVDDVPGRRPPELQPARRGLRRRRDLRRRAVRRRCRRGARGRRDRRGHPDGRLRPALGHRPARRHHRHPGCPQRRAGPRQRRGRRRSPPDRSPARRPRARVRRAHPRPRPRPLVLHRP